MIADALTTVWLAFLLSIILAAVAFPFVFALSFVNSWLCRRYPKTPGILFMALLTLAGAVIFVALAVAYASLASGPQLL